MDKLLISVFNTDEAAFEGLAALEELHRDGDITMYASTVITKDANGRSSVLADPAHTPRGLLVGAVGGALVGLVGGPAGAAFGAWLGGVGGAMYDGLSVDVTRDFVDEASSALEPGGGAIVADIDESSVTPVDRRLGALGARSFRRPLGGPLDNQGPRQAKAAAAATRKLHGGLRPSSGKARATVESAITSQRRKLDGLVTRIDTARDHQQAKSESGTARRLEPHDPATNSAELPAGSLEP